MTAAPFKNIEVLVVDDEAQIRQVVKSNLLTLGYNVTVSDSAESALQYFGMKPYNILVSDIRLGKMDGLEMGNKLRAKDPAVAMIFMTGKPTSKGIAAAQEMGAIQYIPKPLGAAELGENMAIAARWNVAQLITRAAEKYFSLRGGRMSILENKFQRTKAEVKNIVSNNRDADMLIELAYAKTPHSTRMFSVLDEKMAPFLRII
ncbi:MAG: response regulator [Turneriella sp.]